MTDSRHRQLRRSMVPVYSGLRLATAVGCAGLLRTMPDYFQTTSGLLPDYFRTTSNYARLLRSARPDTGVLGTRPEDQPGPRGNHLLDFLSPCVGSVYIYSCRIRAGFPYIQWRGLLPMLVCGLRSQATRS